MLDKMPTSYICHLIGLKTQFENEMILDASQMLPRCFQDASEMLVRCSWDAGFNDKRQHMSLNF